MRSVMTILILLLIPVMGYSADPQVEMGFGFIARKGEPIKPTYWGSFGLSALTLDSMGFAFRLQGGYLHSGAEFDEANIAETEVMRAGFTLEKSMKRWTDIEVVGDSLVEKEYAGIYFYGGYATWYFLKTEPLGDGVVTPELVSSLSRGDNEAYGGPLLQIGGHYKSIYLKSGVDLVWTPGYNIVFPHASLTVLFK